MSFPGRVFVWQCLHLPIHLTPRDRSSTREEVTEFVQALVEQDDILVHEEATQDDIVSDSDSDVMEDEQEETEALFRQGHHTNTLPVVSNCKGARSGHYATSKTES
jgi:hypothetical protein